MPRLEDIKNLIVLYNRRLQKLREQEALKGINASPEISIEIEDIEHTLTGLQTELEMASAQTTSSLTDNDLARELARLSDDKMTPSSSMQVGGFNLSNVSDSTINIGDISANVSAEGDIVGGNKVVNITNIVSGGEHLIESSAFANQFEALITEKTKDFVGRDFVFNAIDEFMANQPNGYFIIEADPGMGKSSISAEYIRRTGAIAHFNVLAQGIITARQFLESVCSQLVTRYNLPYVTLPPNATQDGFFLARLLDEISGRLKHDERLVIAIDALDEVDQIGSASGANILYLPTSLPEKVYILLTKRPVALPLTVFVPQHHFDLMQYFDENREDVRTYLTQATERLQIRSWIEPQAITTDDFVNTLVDKSENNFMYLYYILHDIEQGAFRELSLKNLPSGLEGYYEDHWRRMGMMTKPLPRTKIKIVYILTEVRELVSRNLICDFSNEDALTVQEILDEWDQFLHKQKIDSQTRYSVYHASFRDFLHRKDIVQAAGVTIKEINALIADDLWGELFGDE